MFGEAVAKRLLLFCEAKLYTYFFNKLCILIYTVLCYNAIIPKQGVI